MNTKEFETTVYSQFKDFLQEGHTPLMQEDFESILSHIDTMSTPTIMQIINHAVSMLPEHEIYCEVGVLRGGMTAAALKGNNANAVCIDDFSQFNCGLASDVIYDEVVKNFESEDSEDVRSRVKLVKDDFHVVLDPLQKDVFMRMSENRMIGVYYYDAAHDYKTELEGLAFGLPYLASEALIFVDDTSDDDVKRAVDDFLSDNKRTMKRILYYDVEITPMPDPVWWRGFQAIVYKR